MGNKVYFSQCWPISVNLFNQAFKHPITVQITLMYIYDTLVYTLRVIPTDAFTQIDRRNKGLTWSLILDCAERNIKMFLLLKMAWFLFYSILNWCSVSSISTWPNIESTNWVHNITCTCNLTCNLHIHSVLNVTHMFNYTVRNKRCFVAIS